MGRTMTSRAIVLSASFVVAIIVLCNLPQAEGRCSPAEKVCGKLCCCVTCSCLENPHRCEDMWGKATDPVGTVNDKRFEDAAWLEEHHRQHMEQVEKHKESMKEKGEL